MGHAVRSRVILEHLLSRGHQLEIMASSRAADFLSARFPEVHRIHGLHILYDENRVRRGPTLVSNALKGMAALPRQIASYFKLVEDFAPEIVISDFESWTYFYAKAHGLPIVSIDNMQIVSRCTHPPELLSGIRREFEVHRAFIRGKLPFCDHYLITTYFFPQVRRDKTTLVPPILRPEVLSAPVRDGEHLLVYQTAEGHGALAEALTGLGIPCRIYGMRRELTEDVVEGPLTYRPFDEETFVEDLASARAVICGGGFTLLGECVYLRKPALCVPVSGQVEQILNGRYLEREGYGMVADGVDDIRLRRFIADLDRYRERLASYEQHGNEVTFGHLDRMLAQGVRESNPPENT